MSALLTPDLAEIKRAAEIIIGANPGRVVEMRVPNTAERTWSGFYNDFHTLAQDAFDLSSKESTPNVYWTLQEIESHLIKEGRENKIYAEAERTTNDAEVRRYVWLPIDCDPLRPAQVSSTDAEKSSALVVAINIREFLQSQGIPSLLSDSGNGYHVLVALDILNQNGTSRLIEKVLKALNHRFGTEAVKIDTSIYNPSRILKIYGSIARKGPNTTERPWRLSRLVEVSEKLNPLSENQLEDLLTEILKGVPDEKQRDVTEAKKYETPLPGTLITEGRNNAVRDYAWHVWRHQESDTPDAADLREKVYKFNSEFCCPPLGEDELNKTVLSSTVKQRRIKEEAVLCDGRVIGPASVLNQTALLESEAEKIANIEARIDTTRIQRPVFPYWLMNGTTIYENLVKPAVEKSGKQRALVFMPALVCLMNYLHGQIVFADEEVNLNQFLGLISPAGDFHKSTCCNLAFEYLQKAGLLTFDGQTNPEGKVIVTKPGSSEGLGKMLYKINAKHAVIFFDELSNMVAKSGIENASLSSDLLVWAESRLFSNIIKSTKDNYTFAPGTYCFTWMWNTTERGFPGQWSNICGKASGLADRTIFALSEEKQRQGPNRKIDLSGAIETRKAVDAAHSIGVFRYEDPEEAERCFSGLNDNKRSEARAKAFALAFAVELGKPVVDAECIERGIELANYAWHVQQYLAPIEASNLQGRLQKTILRELIRHGGKMTYRDLSRELDYLAHGDLWDKAFTYLVRHSEVVEWHGRSAKNQKTHMVGRLKQDQPE